MLIKERLPIPIEKHENGTLHWFVGASAFLVLCLAFQDYCRLNFGLDITQFLLELAIAGAIVILPTTLVVGISAAIWHTFNRKATDGVILSSVLLGPMAIFLILAHLFMSFSLSSLKLNFRHASQLDSSDELEMIVKIRDKYLDENGYVRLGTWKASGHDGDCVAVYLFVGAF